MGTKIQFKLSPEEIAASVARNEARRLAREAAKTPEQRAQEDREAAAAARRAELRAQEKAEQAARNAALRAQEDREAAGFATARQIAYLINLGVSDAASMNLSKKDASWMIDNVKCQREHGHDISPWQIVE